MEGLLEQNSCWILKPISIINSLFDKDHSLSNVEEFFKEKLSSDHELYKIPSLNDVELHSLTSGTLVRFRCMVQDIFDPELYLALFEAKDPATNSTMLCSSKYKELADAPEGWEVDYNAPSTVTKECQTLYCTSMPAENKWSKEAYKNKGHYWLETDACEKVLPRSTSKRSHNAMEETDLPNDEGAMDVCALENEDDKQDVKRTKVDRVISSDTSSNSLSHASVDLNLPLPGGKCCLVKVYDNLDSYRVTDMVEFIGILSVDPSLVHHDQASDELELCTPGLYFEENVAEVKAHHPPPSLVPRLYCITAYKMAHSNPLLLRNLEIPVSLIDVSELYETVLSARSTLIDLLTTALMGDKLAAEYMLLNLISSVHVRHGLMPLGKFSLNLINPSISKVSSILQGILQHLLPKSHLLPMSLANMNTLKMMPKKNFEANRLEAGMLQLTAGTHLILDETLLSTGQLNNTGCLNLQALTNILTWQKVKYDFQYDTVEISCDLPIVILSEGKSLLQVDCNLPVKATSSPDPEILQSLQHAPLENLNKLRIYLGLSRLLRYELTQDVQCKLEQDFVEMRKTDPHMNADLFHFMLDMARLLSLSSGHTELQLDTWHKLKAMEVERRGRLNQVPSNQSGQ